MVVPLCEVDFLEWKEVNWERVVKMNKNKIIEIVT